MSSSPALRRLSSAGSLRLSPGMDGLVNYYEAEEERIINLLSRKLEKLRMEKVNLENALEAESESQVNRLNRELTALKRQQQQQQQQQQNGNQAGPSMSAHGPISLVGSIAHDPRFPAPEIMLEALRRENESLRTRLVDMERDYLRIRRLNEVYREELIEHRTRAGTPTESLVGLDATLDGDMISYSPHRRTPSSGSPTSAILTLSSRSQRAQPQGVPIPLPRTISSSTHIYHPHHIPEEDMISSESSLTHSPSSAESPYTFSPVNGTSHNPASYVSNATNLTTPPSSMSLQSNPPLPYPMQATASQLSYPSVPPPSLSSSLGSPVIPFHPTSAIGLDGLELNATIPSRRNSTTVRRRGSSSARVAETGSLRDISESRSRSRRDSVDRNNYVLPSPTTTRSPPSNPTTSTPIPIRQPRSREGTPVNR